MKNDLVVKSNDLIEARYELSLNEQKIMLYSVSKIDRENDNFNTINVSVKKFFQLLDTSTERYTELREIVRTLRGKEIIIDTPQGEIITGWLSSIEYKQDTGTIDLEFSQKLLPYLLQLKERFTRYQLRNILYLKSKYGIRLYELMKQYQTIGMREFKLEELKYILFIEGQYKRIYDLERFVLKPAIKEINKYTDINLSYEKNKTGRNITSILFKIESKDKSKLEYVNYLDESYNIKDMQKKMGLINVNLNSEQVITLYERAVEFVNDESMKIFEYIRLNYEYIKRRKGVRNIYSYLLQAIEEDYASARGQISLDYYL